MAKLSPKQTHGLGDGKPRPAAINQRVPAKSLQTPGVGIAKDSQPAVSTKTPPANIHGVALRQDMSTHAARTARG